MFVGYGIVAPEYKWDDYKGADLKGKVLLDDEQRPRGDSPAEPNLFAGKTRLWYGRWDYKYLMAARMGAAGAIVIHTTPSAGYGWQVVQTSWSGEQFELPDDGAPRVQMKMWATEELSKKIAALGGKDLDALRAAAESRAFKPVPLGVTLSLAFTNTMSKKESGNVIGVLHGCGSEARRRGGHLHGAPRPPRDEGRAASRARTRSTTAPSTTPRASRASSRSRARSRSLKKTPARSVYFALVAGEEQGLLGSEFLAKHPPVPAGQHRRERQHRRDRHLTGGRATSR